jgi:NADPH:quinone reductase-like Zn-dependent oxidoreductase
MNTMTAYRIHRFGDDALQADQIPVPEPGPGQVVVLVHAASVNPVDYKTRDGHYPLVGDDQLPYTLGRDFAGVVEHVGDDAGTFHPGEAVYGFVGQGQGAYAQFVRIERSAIARKPATLDYRHAGAVPLAALTAWQGLFDHGALGAGQRVLVHAAAGGVGHLAMQFAKTRGAETIVTASGDGIDFVRALGADHVIDYRNQRFEDAVRDVDVVLDLVGGETQQRSWQVLRRGGALISSLQEPSAEMAEQYGVRAMRYTAQPNGAQLAGIGALIDAGRVKVHLAETFRLDEAHAALARVEAGHVRGKIVLDMLA